MVDEWNDQWNEELEEVELLDKKYKKSGKNGMPGGMEEELLEFWTWND